MTGCDSADPAGRAVLVVDDEETVADALASGLTACGFDTVVAYSGEQALARMDESPFGAVLIDYNMPGMRGDELQRIARERDPLIAVIIITATADLSLAVQCMKDGAFDFVNKPFDLHDVAARVEKALEHRGLVLEKERLRKENEAYRGHLERRAKEQAEKLREMLLGTVGMLNHVQEAKDENTRGHSYRVAEVASVLASYLFPNDVPLRARLRVSALLHDIGKLGIPEAILNKPDTLTPEEFEAIKKHPVTSETILRPLFSEPETLSIVRNHHEAWDGSGYPDGLSGERIPLGARIVAVADAYDAMTSPRPNRPALSLEETISSLRDGAGTQWDPTVVEALLHLIETGELERLIEGARFPRMTVPE